MRNEEDLKKFYDGQHTFRSLVGFKSQPIFFLRIDDSHCCKICCFPIPVHCFEDGYVGKQPVPWKVYSAENWLKNTKKTWIGALVAVK